MAYIISFEGPRGVGKSTTAEHVFNTWERQGIRVVNHRSLPKDPTRSLWADKAKSLFLPWKSQFEIVGTEIIPRDPQTAEEIAWRRFDAHIVQAGLPNTVAQSSSVVADILFYDRHLDTTVVYDAAEIVLSNPQKYSQRMLPMLLHTMWEKMKGCGADVPQTTFFFSYSDADTALRRSYQHKMGTGASYQMDAFQVRTQQVVSELFPISFSLRQIIYPFGNIVPVPMDQQSPESAALVVASVMQQILEPTKIN